MKISLIWALIAAIATTTLMYMAVVIRRNNIINARNNEIVRRRVQDQITAFQKVDLRLAEATHESKVVGRIGPEAEWVEENYGISA